MAGKRPTQAEIDYRVNRVAKLLSQGATRSELVQYAANEWGIATRTADFYIAEARKVLKMDFDIDRRQFTAELLAQLSSVQKAARANGQLHVALGCINTMARIAQVLG